MSDNPIFSYTRRDYEGARQEGIAKIPIISRGQWTDLNATDPGIIIIDYLHALVDMMNYYQDHQALETFITTAKERANIFRLAKQLSYQIRPAKGATCEVTFTSSLLYDHPVKIPKYTKVSTLSGIPYLTLQDAYLPANSSRITVPCVQGTIEEKEYKGTGISRFSNIVGAMNQYVILNAKHIDIDTITVTDNLGRVWEPVDYIVFSREGDRVYEAELRPDDTVSVKFGDGERGVVPGETEVFTIKYLTSLAEEGVVSANSIVVLEDDIIDEGSYVTFSVNNNKSSVGGHTSQTSEEIRALAPGAIKAQDRAVTLSDFENLAKLVSGVVDAKAYDINVDPNIPYHEVRVLVIPDSNDEASTESLKTSVYNYLSKRMIPPTNLQVITPSKTRIDISVTVVQANTGVEGGLEYDIRQAIIAYFDEISKNIGETFYPSDLSNALYDVSNVRYIAEITPSTPVQIANNSVASLGDINIIVQ